MIRRIRLQSYRPLLQTTDPEATVRRLMQERYSIYAEADVTVPVHDSAYDITLWAMINAIVHYLVQ